MATETKTLIKTGSDTVEFFTLRIEYTEYAIKESETISRIVREAEALQSDPALVIERPAERLFYYRRFGSGKWETEETDGWVETDQPEEFTGNATSNSDDKRGGE